MTRSTGLLRIVGLSLLVSAIAPARGLSQTRCEPNLAGTTERHFIVLAARSGRFYEGGGPAFAMLIRIAGEQTTVDAVGIDEAGGTPVFGAIPERTFREFLREPRAASDVMLRLSISPAQYQGGLKILRAWDRRARERALLYPDVFMDNILLVKQVTEDLNRCGESVKLYTLDWGVEDDISEHNRPSNIPFEYFKALRRLNESRHVRDRDMPLTGGVAR